MGWSSCPERSIFCKRATWYVAAVIPAEALRLWYRLASLPLGRISSHSALAPQWDGLGVHRHRVATLVVACSGQVRVELGRQQHQDLATGEAAVLGAWCWHAHSPPRHGAVAILGATSQGVDLILVWPGGEWRTQIADRNLHRLMAGLADLAESAQAAAIASVMHGVAATVPVTHAAPPALQRMSDFLWLHRTRPIAAADLLAASGLSARAAHSLFVAHFGTTPKQYLLQCRLALAQRLLVEGRVPGEVWRECGFRSRADLTRRFRLACGAAPRRWARSRATSL